jgi:hypothetical protein
MVDIEGMLASRRILVYVPAKPGNARPSTVEEDCRLSVETRL